MHIYIQPYNYSYIYIYIYIYICRYIDLGSGTGAAAIRIASNNPTVTVNALNLCDKQNQIAKDNAIAAGIAERMTVTTGTYIHEHTLVYTRTCAHKYLIACDMHRYI